jgi:hypothetical protein
MLGEIGGYIYGFYVTTVEIVDALVFLLLCLDRLDIILVGLVK